jgi:hypothetical protein
MLADDLDRLIGALARAPAGSSLLMVSRPFHAREMSAPATID